MLVDWGFKNVQRGFKVSFPLYRCIVRLWPRENELRLRMEGVFWQEVSLSVRPGSGMMGIRRQVRYVGRP